MKIIHIITHFLTLNYPQYVISFCVTAGLIVAGSFLVWKYKPAWKNFAYFVLLFLLIRLALFGHYYSWGFYTDELSVDDVGWRQKSVLDYEHNKFFKDQKKIKFFAVGSSQTYVIYKDYAEQHKELAVFHLSSMSPLDLYLYRKYIADRNPEYLLLYLSEFDMARPPDLDAAKIAPPQGLGLWGILPTLSEVSRLAHSQTAFKEMLAGELFPEYKYSFVFKGFKDKYTKKNEALHIPSLMLVLHPDAQQLKEYIAKLTEDMDERWIKYNKYFLAKFLSYCRSRSLKVIIIEGQYNPLAYTEKSMGLNRMVRKELQGLTKEFDNVTFITRSNVVQFKMGDYMDTVHVNPRPAYRFVKSLLKSFK